MTLGNQGTERLHVWPFGGERRSIRTEILNPCVGLLCSLLTTIIKQNRTLVIRQSRTARLYKPSHLVELLQCERQGRTLCFLARDQQSMEPKSAESKVRNAKGIFL